MKTINHRDTETQRMNHGESDFLRVSVSLW